MNSLRRKFHSNHRNRINVSFLGTNASTGLLPGYFFFAVFQTEKAELPEATTLFPIRAICLPLYFSISGENFAKNSTSFIPTTFLYGILKDKKTFRLRMVGCTVGNYYTP